MISQTRHSRAKQSPACRVVAAVLRLFGPVRRHYRDALPEDDGAVLVCNHVSVLDPLYISSLTHRRILFVISREAASRRWLRGIIGTRNLLVLDREASMKEVLSVVRRARREMEAGHLVCVFPEAARSRTGHMLSFVEGATRITRRTPYAMFPVCITGALERRKNPGREIAGRPLHSGRCDPVCVTLGRRLCGNADPMAIRREIEVLSAQQFEDRRHARRTLGYTLIRSCRRSWCREAIADTTGKRLSAGKTLTGAIVLADLLRPEVGDDANVGVLLPTSVGAALTNMAIALMGKTSVNLNYTSSRESIRSAVWQAELRVVVSSRKFLQKMDKLEAPEGTLLLEDLLPKATLLRRLSALLRARFAPASRLLGPARPGPDDVATILFSSGTVSEPKGVMLTHHNLLSNIESFLAIIHFSHRDRMCAVLPFFHSFGFTCTLWCPLFCGFTAFYHVSPLDAAKIAEIVGQEQLTILVATPTFLLSYMRRASCDDFSTLRIVVVGAEKLKTHIADAFEEKYGVRPLEGYGSTEMSPVAAVNVPNVDRDGIEQVGSKDGSIGHPVPGVAARIVEPETYDPLPLGEAGLMLVHGPNIMQGYLRLREQTARVLRDGWYESGDIASIDRDGFIFIRDRLSRYSKIGGEMVPHMAVEECLSDGADTIEPQVVVTSAPDERKGEQLVVLYLEEAGPRERLLQMIKESDLPNLWRPRKENFVHIEEIPTLGSGKLDIRRVKEIARDFVEGRPTMMQRIANRVRDAL